MSVPPPGPGSRPPSEDRPHTAVATALREVPRTLSRARRRFLAVNGAAFLLTALLSGTAGGLFATRPVSGMPLGIVLAALQLAVLPLTSWWYDHSLRRDADPLLDLMRRHAEPGQSSPPRPGLAEARSPWSYSPQGRQR